MFIKKSGDIALDRNVLKSQLIRWRLIALVLAASLLSLVVLKIDDIADILPSTAHKPYIAKVSIKGVIDNSAEDKNNILKNVAEDNLAYAVIIYIDSPGGSVVGSEELYSNIRDIAQSKPVVAVMGNFAASGGYMIALGADYIVARNNTMTGSIGVVAYSGEITELLGKIGISTTTIKTSPLKAAPSFVEKVTPEVILATKNLIDDMQKFFIESIVERRKLPLAEVEKLADGRVFTGRQAAHNGLIDAIGGEKEARDWLKNNEDVDDNLEIEEVFVHNTDNSWIEKFKPTTSSIAEYLSDLFMAVKIKEKFGNLVM
jgi:protease-4